MQGLSANRAANYGMFSNRRPAGTSSASANITIVGKRGAQFAPSIFEMAVVCRLRLPARSAGRARVLRSPKLRGNDMSRRRPSQVRRCHFRALAQLGGGPGLFWGHWTDISVCLSSDSWSLGASIGRGALAGVCLPHPADGDQTTRRDCRERPSRQGCNAAVVVRSLPGKLSAKIIVTAPITSTSASRGSPRYDCPLVRTLCPPRP